MTSKNPGTPGLWDRIAERIGWRDRDDDRDALERARRANEEAARRQYEVARQLEEERAHLERLRQHLQVITRRRDL